MNGKEVCGAFLEEDLNLDLDLGFCVWVLEPCVCFGALCVYVGRRWERCRRREAWLRRQFERPNFEAQVLAI